MDDYHAAKNLRNSNPLSSMNNTFHWSTPLDNIHNELRITEIFHKPNEYYPDPSHREEATLKGMGVPDFLKEFREKKKL